MDNPEQSSTTFGDYSFPSSFIKALLDSLELNTGARLLIVSSDWGVHSQAINLGYNVISVTAQQGYEQAFKLLAETKDVDGAIVLPPFGTRISENLIPAHLPAINTRFLEDIFIVLATQTLSAQAKMVALVPSSLLFASSRQETRQWMIDHGLYAVIDIPKQPRLFDHVAISMAVILFQHTQEPSAGTVTFGRFDAATMNLTKLYETLPAISKRPLDADFQQVNLDDLSKDLRLDPQHYSPEYLNLIPPEGYLDRSLVEMSTVLGGFSLKREQRSEDRTDQYDLPYIQVRHVLRSGELAENPYWVASQDIQNLASRVALPGDILVTTTGTIGRVAIVPAHFKNGVLFDTSLRRIRINQDAKIDSRFLADFLRSDIGQLQMNRFAGGVAQLHLTSENLESLRVFVPHSAITDKKPDQTTTDHATITDESVQAANYAEIIESEIIRFLRGVSPKDPSWRDTFRTKWRKLSADPDWKGLEMTVLEDLPTPIAIPFRRYQMAMHNPYERLPRMISLVEACIYFTFHVVLADFFRSDWTDPYRPVGDSLNAVRGKQSNDYRLKFIGEVLQLVKDNRVQLFVPELVNCPVVSIGDLVRDSLRNPTAHSAPGAEPFVRSQTEQFSNEIKTLLEGMTLFKSYTLCRVRAHYFHQGVWRYQVERFRGAEYDFNLAEEIYEQQETPAPELLQAEREHLVLLSPDKEVLDLYPFYQLYYGEETARESHLCFVKQTERDTNGRVIKLIGESVRNSREIELPGSTEYDQLLEKLRK
jgi:hypothetical protein